MIDLHCKCSRCGKPLSVEKWKDIENPKCSHCNLEHVMDKKARRKSYFILPVIMLVIVFISAIVQVIFNIHMFIMIPFIFIVAFFTNRIVNFILARLKWLSYEPLIKAKK